MMSWSLLWISGFLALYLFLGAQRLAVILMSMLCGAFIAHAFLGQAGLIAGGVIGCGLGLILVYLKHNRVTEIRRTAVH